MGWGVGGVCERERKSACVRGGVSGVEKRERKCVVCRCVPQERQPRPSLISPSFLVSLPRRRRPPPSLLMSSTPPPLEDMDAAEDTHLVTGEGARGESHMGIGEVAGFPSHPGAPPLLLPNCLLSSPVLPPSYPPIQRHDGPRHGPLAVRRPLPRGPIPVRGRGHGRRDGGPGLGGRPPGRAGAPPPPARHGRPAHDLPHVHLLRLPAAAHHPPRRSGRPPAPLLRQPGHHFGHGRRRDVRLVRRGGSRTGGGGRPGRQRWWGWGWGGTPADAGGLPGLGRHFCGDRLGGGVASVCGGEREGGG